jgi:hypothetical protein
MIAPFHNFSLHIFPPYFSMAEKAFQIGIYIYFREATLW